MEKDNLKYLDHDLYHVETHHGKKAAHIDGYCYQNERGYQCVQFTFCYVNVSDLKEKEKIDLAEESSRQYQYDYTMARVSSYYKEAKELPYEEVTESTPDGWYVDYKEE